MEKNIEFRQIILVTDGESNVGPNPVNIAKEAKNKGITISTIGVVNGMDRDKPLMEVKEIASSGGGLWELTDINSLSSTMSVVTMKSVYKTIEQAVNKELKEIMGTGLEDIHPDSRKKVTDIIDKLGEEITIKCCIVIDCSGSMANKIDIAKGSIINLLRVLQSRKGSTSIAVIGYPAENEYLCSVLCDFTKDIVELEEGLLKIDIGGITPTGPALKRAIELLIKDENQANNEIEDEEESLVFSSSTV